MLTIHRENSSRYHPCSYCKLHIFILIGYVTVSVIFRWESLKTPLPRIPCPIFWSRFAPGLGGTGLEEGRKGTCCPTLTWLLFGWHLWQRLSFLWLHFLSTSVSVHGSFRAGSILFEIPATTACFWDLVTPSHLRVFAAFGVVAAFRCC